MAGNAKEHLLHITDGFLQGDEKLDEDDQPRCDFVCRKGRGR